MPILTIASSKGGAGKTTVARALVAALARQEIDVLVVDADPTQALHRWVSTIYEGNPVKVIAEASEDRLNEGLHGWREEHALVLVDTPGFSNLAAVTAIAAADFVLVPTLTSEADLVEARATVRKVEAAGRNARRPIPVRVLMNGVQRTLVQGHAADTLTAEGLPVLAATLGHRTEYKAVSHTGNSPAAGPVGREVSALLKELQDMGWVPAGERVA